jgi:hypothetical protein
MNFYPNLITFINVIELEYKSEKKNLAEPYETLSDVVQNIREDSIYLAI